MTVSEVLQPTKNYHANVKFLLKYAMCLLNLLFVEFENMHKVQLGKYMLKI